MAGGTITNSNTVSLELPAGLFAALEKESRRKRKSVAQMLAQILEDRADYLEAERRMKDIRSGKVKLISAEDVYKSLEKSFPSSTAPFSIMC